MKNTNRLEIPLAADTRVVPTMAIPLLIAEEFEPGADPKGTNFQAALRTHDRMLNRAVREGAVKAVSYYGEPEVQEPPEPARAVPKSEQNALSVLDAIRGAGSQTPGRGVKMRRFTFTCACVR